jgi:hypothetical protein
MEELPAPAKPQPELESPKTKEDNKVGALFQYRPDLR